MSIVVLGNLWGWNIILGPFAFHCSWGLVIWHLERLWLWLLSLLGLLWGCCFWDLCLHLIWDSHGLILDLSIDIDNIFVLVELLNSGILLLSLHVLLLLIDAAVAP